MFTIKDAARYSVKPHELGFCGPTADCADILRGDDEKKIKSTLRRFPAVIRYCRRIAKANNIKDPLREDVLEAYWLGNDLLKKARYENGGYPHHSYHVWQEEPFNQDIVLTEKMKNICQVTATKVRRDYWAFHWEERVQKLDGRQVKNLRHYTKINRWLKGN